MRWVLFFVLALALFACTALSPAEQQELARLILENQQGQLTQAQVERLYQLLQQSQTGEIDWNAIGAGVAGIVGSLLGVRVWRGPITARKGSAPSNS